MKDSGPKLINIRIMFEIGAQHLHFTALPLTKYFIARNLMSALYVFLALAFVMFAFPKANGRSWTLILL